MNPSEVQFRELRRDDKRKIREWLLSDRTFSGDFLFGWFKSTDSASMIQRLDEILKGSATYKFFAVELANNTIPVGLLLQQKSSTRYDCCHVGFFVDSSYRGKGFGARAMSLLVDHILRTTKGISRIEASTSSSNIPSQRALERVGFRRIAANHIPKNDTVLYSIERRISRPDH